MKPIFVGGCQRSGTTLLGSLLGGHSDILCIPETLFIADTYLCFKSGNKVYYDQVWDKILNSRSFVRHWEFTHSEIQSVEKGLGKVTSYRELIELIVNQYSRRIKRANFQYWVSHSPNNIIKSDILLEIFPDARFIHIIRDGRAVANSLKKMDFGANTSYYAAYQWNREVALAFMAQYLSGNRDRFIEVRYEDILLKTDVELDRICRFLDINYEKQMLLNQGYTNPKFNEPIHQLIGSKIDKTRIDSWKRELTNQEIAIFQAHAKDTMRLLGYQPLCTKYHFPLWSKLKVFIYEHIKGEIFSKVKIYLREYKAQRILKTKNKKII